MDSIPQSVEALIGQAQYVGQCGSEVSRANIRALCATVKNSNPVYWSKQEANAIAGGEVAPLSMLSAWSRPERWSPDGEQVIKPLQLHFDLKELLAFPTAIVSDFESIYYQPVKVGDCLTSCQVLQSISEEKSTRLGRGRFWVIEVHYHNQNQALAGIDSFNCFGYRREAE